MAPKSRPGALGGKGAQAPGGNTNAAKRAGGSGAAGAGGEYTATPKVTPNGAAHTATGGGGGGGAMPARPAGGGAKGGGGGGPGKLFGAILVSGTVTLGAVMTAQAISDEESRTKIESKLPMMKPVFDSLTPLYLQLCDLFPALKDDKKGGGGGGGGGDEGNAGAAPDETPDDKVSEKEYVLVRDAPEEKEGAEVAATPSKYSGKYGAMDLTGHSHHPQTLKVEEELETAPPSAAENADSTPAVADEDASVVLEKVAAGIVAATEAGTEAADVTAIAALETAEKAEEEAAEAAAAAAVAAADLAAESAAAATQDQEAVLAKVTSSIAVAAAAAKVAAEAAAAEAAEAAAAEAAAAIAAAAAAAADTKDVLHTVGEGIAAATAAAASASAADKVAAAAAATEPPTEASTDELESPTPAPEAPAAPAEATPAPAAAAEVPPISTPEAAAAPAAAAVETVAAVTTIVKEFIPVDGALYGTVDDLQAKVKEMETQLASQLASDAVKLQTTLEAAYAQRVQTLSEETEEAIAIAEAATQRRTDAEQELQQYKEAFESEVERIKVEAVQGVQEQLAKDRDALMKEMHEHLISQEMRHRATIQNAINDGEKRIQEECEANMMIDVGEERAKRIVRMEEMFVRTKAVEQVLADHVQSNTSYRDSHMVLMATEMLQQAVASKGPIQQEVERLRVSGRYRHAGAPAGSATEGIGGIHLRG